MGLLMVLPICDKEIEQASHLVKWMRMLGGMEEKRILVVPSWKARWDIPPILNSLRTTFGTVEVWYPPLDDDSGWPVSSNSVFYQVMEYLDSDPDPKFWWECDVCPLREGYWAALEKEYAEAGKPYMGTINQSRMMTTRDGVVVEGRPRPRGYKFLIGHHLVGAGIYPADFWQRCEGVRHLSDMAFDIQLGPEIKPYAHDTPLLAHRWQTCRYRRNEEGLLTMDDVDPDDNLYSGRVIPPEAVVVHGCKDTSLIDLLMREHLLTSRKEVG